MEDRITLLELNQQVKEGIKKYLPDSYWVVAEISEIKINRRGHCYLDLIEKDELEDKIIAKARAIIWSYTFRMLQPYFKTTTGKDLSEGLKVLIQVSVEFHELFGYSLFVNDIDPSYTLGELARKKMETLQRLEEEGIFNMNRELKFPLVPQKIAIISSETAAGYKDFMEQLMHNPYGYTFYTKLFQAYMQGDEVQQSVIEALEHIFQYEDLFDAVAIIRGGGAQSDLSYFDQYELAANIAQFPLPVITGIGHEKDESVSDMVAHTKLKTPTAVADFLINQVYDFEQTLFERRDQFIDQVNQYLTKERQYLDQTTYRIVPLTQNLVNRAANKLSLFEEKLKYTSKKQTEAQKQHLVRYHQQLNMLSTSLIKQKQIELSIQKQNLGNYVNKYLSDQKIRLQHLDKANSYLDPKNILRRGFSITQKNNKPIKDSKVLQDGDIIKTYFHKGEIESKVMKKDQDSNH